MTYNPPTAQVTQQKDVTYGNVQPNTKATKKKTEPSGKKTEIIINPSKSDCQENRTMRFSDYLKLTEKKDDSYLETDMEKRRKNNEKAIEDMKKTKANKDMVATVRKQFEETEIEEGMTMKDFKANRKKLKRREASADAKKRGHVGKEWYNSGRTYSPDEAKRGRAKMDDAERQTRHRSAVDPDNDNDHMYSADRTKNPKKLRKQKAMGESLSFSDFMEARRMDKEGVDRGDSRRAERAAKAKESLAAVKKRQTVLDKHEKKTGNKLDISRSVEGKAHAKNHPGSRQSPKERGAKETSSETHNRRVNRHNQRLIKHGPTTKEKKAAAGYAAYERDYKKSYGQHKSAWD